MARIAAAGLLAAGALLAPGAAAAQSAPFTPKLTATLGTAEQPSKVGAHAPFTTVVTQPVGQAAIKRAVVTLPTGLFANINALQTLCPVAAQADLFGNPHARQTPAPVAAQAARFGCPAGARVGSVNVTSPLVPAAIGGPVF